MVIVPASSVNRLETSKQVRGVKLQNAVSMQKAYLLVGREVLNF